jgi:alkaline phosphatase D
MKYILPVLFFLLFQVVTTAQTLYYPELSTLLDPAQTPFCFGVASGDPYTNSVVIWTKIISESVEKESVHWEVATDTSMQRVVQSGVISTDRSSAFTVKADVQNLEPGMTYFYRFQHKDRYSPIGRTKTAPAGNPSRLSFAVVSCADYQAGYFNAFGDIARRNDLDAVVHLGDYIYEYGPWRQGRKRMLKKQYRHHIPDKTCTTLQDYRTRYGQYRTDRQLQEAHRLHPFIVIWDDHEVANNSNVSGTDGNPAGGEAWEQRKAEGRQAYFEWLPIRENPDRSIIRSFSYGNLADMWMLDGRLEGRSPQARGKEDPAWQSPNRHMLGETQTDWLLKGIKNSTARWKIIGNQVIFSPLNDSKVFDRRPSIAMDRWDGYPAERQHIFDFFSQHQLKNIVVITGDVHTSWAFELTGNPSDPNAYDPKTGKGVMGAEFVSPSVTSFNFDEVVPKIIVAEAKRRFKKHKNNPHLRYLDLTHHGYMTLTLTPGRAQADWFFIKRKDKVDDRVRHRASRFIPFNGTQVVKK